MSVELAGAVTVRRVLARDWTGNGSPLIHLAASRQRFTLCGIRSGSRVADGGGVTCERCRRFTPAPAPAPVTVQPEAVTDLTTAVRNLTDAVNGLYQVVRNMPNYPERQQ